MDQNDSNQILAQNANQSVAQNEAPVPATNQTAISTPISQQAQPIQTGAAATTATANVNASPAPAPKKVDYNKIRDTFGIVGLVAGIVAIFPTFTIPRLQYFSYILAVVSIVFSLICVVRRRMGVLPVIGVIIGLIAFGLVAFESDVLHRISHDHDSYTTNRYN